MPSVISRFHGLFQTVKPRHHGSRFSLRVILCHWYEVDVFCVHQNTNIARRSAQGVICGHCQHNRISIAQIGLTSQSNAGFGNYKNSIILTLDYSWLEYLQAVELGEKVRAYRAIKNLSQADLGKRLGVSDVTVCKMERNKTNALSTRTIALFQSVISSFESENCVKSDKFQTE